ncbi:MAG: NeuD/PglB/VioB family sugar acetyltransferase [Bacteroidia bacterium]
MEQLLIFPFNGNGLEALDCIDNQYEFIGFVDDTPAKQGKSQFGFDVFGREAIERYPNAKILAVPGSPTSYTVRDKIIAQLNVSNERYATLIHPKANVSPLAKLGFNSLIMAGVVITSNAVLGNHVCVLPNTVIHHDSSVGDYTLVGSNVTIAGNTSVGSFCYIGSGTSIINGIRIGDNTLIGMGTNVVKSLPSHSKAVGNPARQL